MRAAIFRTSFVIALALVFAGCGGKKEKTEQETAEAGSQLQASTPRVQAENEFYDWGSVRQGEKVEHLFTLKNAGGAVLNIEKIKASCGCVATLPESRAVPPGGTTTIKATLDTTGRFGPSRKTIAVTTNDPDNPNLVLSMGGYILSDVTVTPTRLSLPNVGTGEKNSAVFTVEPSKGAAHPIKSVTCADPRFKLDLKEGDLKTKATYEVAFAGTDEIGKVRCFIEVHTEGSTAPAMKVPVEFEVSGDITYENRLMVLPDGDKMQSKALVFNSASGKPIEILKTVDTASLFDVTLENNKTNAVTALIKLKDDSRDPYQIAKRGRLVFETTDKKQPKLVVTYTVFGQEPLIQTIKKSNEG